MDKFGTIIIDPPWPYNVMKDKTKGKGYSNFQYQPLTIEELAGLPIQDIAADDSVLLLWCTWPFILEAGILIETWGFKLITGLPWIKIVGEVDPVKPVFKPSYGVGYWLRGCTEPILIAKKPSGKSFKSNYIGLLSEGAKHSRKPDSLYELAETSYPGPYLELFARRKREGWTQLGNELEGDGQDIRESLPKLCNKINPMASN